MDTDVRLQLFELHDCIGTGGMGTVYRGTHVETEVDVAVKFISRTVDERLQALFRREVQSHAALVHPGIVYLFEYGLVDEATSQSIEGVEPDNPFVAMELADVGTLRELMPMTDWALVRGLVVQVLDALAHAHARGVVHRDLKPENLLLFRDDGKLQIKVTDFGIAHAVGAEDDTDTELLEQSVGTPVYMPPEQIHGKWRSYGPWTDLYALGCIVWEMVVGRPPFKGETPFAVAMDHCRKKRPPLEPRFAVPEELESWIHRAMAIEPEDRFQRAADAARSLPPVESTTSGDIAGESGPEGATRESITDSEALATTQLLPTLAPTQNDQSDSGTQLENSSDLPESATSSGNRDQHGNSDGQIPTTWRVDESKQLPAPLVGSGLGLFGLREPPFVGREAIRDRLWKNLYESIEHRSLRSTIVAGEVGVGKSRLASWLSIRADELGTALVYRAVHTSAGGGPGQGLSGMVRQAFRTWKLSRSEVYEHLLQNLPVLKDEDPQRRNADAQALTELVRPTSDDSEPTDGPSHHFASRQQKYALVERLLRRWAQRRPVLLWFDDIQWDRESLGMVEYLQEHAARLPSIYLLVTIRSDIVSEQSELKRRIDAIVDHPAIDRIDLEPLTIQEHQEMLDRLLPLRPDLRNRISRRTEGNPLFAIQLLRHWIERAEVEFGSQGFEITEGSDVDVPDDIHNLWMERLKRLVDEMSGPRDHKLWESLELAATLGKEVNQREWIAACRRADSPALDLLVDRLVKSGLAQRNEEDWTFTHGLLVDSLQRRADEHGRWREHNRCCVATIEELYQERPQETALRRANHWLEAGELERALDPLMTAAHEQYKIGDVHERQRVLEKRRRVLDELDAAHDDLRRLENQIEYSHLWFYLGESLRGEELARRSLVELEQRRTSALSVRAAQILGMCRRVQGATDDARRLLNQALEGARKLNNDWLIMTILLELGWLEIPAGQFDDADRYLSELVERATEANEQHLKLWGMAYTAWLQTTFGDTIQASETLAFVYDRAQSAGFRSLESSCLQLFGDIARYDDRTDEAFEQYQLSRRVTPRDDGLLDILGELGVAQTELKRGNTDEAAEYLANVKARIATREAHKYNGWTDLVEMTLKAARGEWTKLDEQLPVDVEEWLSEMRWSRDIPWLLELAADYARSDDHLRRADDLEIMADKARRRLNEKALDNGP